MLAPDRVELAKRLLAEGRLSQRKIAAVTGMSRASITAIALERRTDRQRRPAELPEDDDLGPLARCGGCGGLVHLPCRLCQLRSRLALERRAARLAGRSPHPLGTARLGSRTE
jgi:hypothetical protein